MDLALGVDAAGDGVTEASASDDTPEESVTSVSDGISLFSSRIVTGSASFLSRCFTACDVVYVLCGMPHIPQREGNPARIVMNWREWDVPELA